MIDDVAHKILAHAAGTTFSSEEVLMVLNVLPPDSSVLALVLSRGFLEYAPSTAIKHGHGLALLSHYPRRVLFDDFEDTIAEAAKLGDLRDITKLWEIAGPATVGRAGWLKGTKTSLLAVARMHGHLNAAEAGQAKVLSWGLDRGYLGELTVDDALLSAMTGNVALLERWFTSQSDTATATASIKRSDLVAVSTTIAPTGFTIDFITDFASNLDMSGLLRAPSMASITAVLWWCVQTGAKYKSLLPLSTEQWLDKPLSSSILLVARKITILMQSGSDPVSAGRGSRNPRSDPGAAWLTTIGTGNGDGASANSRVTVLVNASSSKDFMSQVAGAGLPSV
ncbi:hypothetical protein BC828DRAFT_405449 [Blastocladiella britannica]|nr:hypothetical protein BC828DRAFT_405449 [Blastocladiella britannica]